ncbi:uncharacterized protein LOC124136541 [Haliotis rufescens]|uniref:uncharacterized protein LOC124136541 n=1 Tax=Haliotis rufescens TaxID=6454 RepID=UPI00201EFC3F|nr:uncharacterized protein LOC124136541 [Haliotis rufescens]
MKLFFSAVVVAVVVMMLTPAECKRRTTERKDRPKNYVLPRNEAAPGVPDHVSNFLVNGVIDHYRHPPNVNHQDGGVKEAELQHEMFEMKRRQHGEKVKKRSGLSKKLLRGKRFVDAKAPGWTNGIVPYEFGNISTSQQATVLQAMATIEEYTCIRFFERGSPGYSVSHTNYLLFIKTSSCWSYIGMHNSPQYISPCTNFFTVLHEIIHALGAWHEHQHYDRQQHLQYFPNHVRSGAENNFALPPASWHDDFVNLPLDLQSVMMYGDYDFSIDRSSRKTIDPYSDDVADTRDDFWIVMHELSIAYQCASRCNGAPPTCSNGGYAGIYNDACSCICPKGLDPATSCATLQSGVQGGVFTLTPSNPEVQFTTPGAPDTGIAANSKYMWIFWAPDDGSKIVVDIEHIFAAGTSSSCISTLRISRDLIGQSGSEYCGSEFGKSIISLGNVVVIELDAGTSANSYIKGTATLQSVDDWCYDLGDNGETYNDNVNVTVTNAACLPWSQASSCDYNPAEMTLRADYSGNNCRNPEMVLPQPWCYTSIDQYSCKISLCDVCQYGRTYDSYDNCDMLIASNTDYCSTADSQYGCRKTCEELATITTTSSTTTTPTTTTATTTTSTTTSPTTTTPTTSTTTPTTTTATTTTSTTTTPTTTTSTTTSTTTTSTTTSTTTTPTATTTTPTPPTKVCPSGYSLHSGDGQCYKFFTTKKNYGKAKTQCALDGGLITSVESAAVNLFLVQLRAAAGSRFPASPMFINARWHKRKQYWYWVPLGKRVKVASLYTNWNSNNPDGPDGDAAAKIKCAVMEPASAGNQWVPSRCNKNYFICRTNTVSAVLSARSDPQSAKCRDLRSECQKFLHDDPAMCNKKLAKSCRATCGRCNPNGMTCAVTTPSAADHVSLKSSETQLTPGQFVKYQCRKRNVLKSGALRRACTLTGALTGDAPTCTDISNTVSSVNGRKLGPRLSFPADFQLYGKSVIRRNGRVSQWKAFCATEGDVIFMVLRKKRKRSEIVGVNKVKCMNDRVMTWDVAEEERITVQPGDYLGAGDLEGGHLQYSWCDGGKKMVYDTYLESELRPGETVAMEGGECLVIEMDAVIVPL